MGIVGRFGDIEVTEAVGGLRLHWVGLLVAAASIIIGDAGVQAQQPMSLQSPSGLRLVVAEEDTCPTLRMLLPGGDAQEKGIVLVYPEHVTVLQHGSTEAKHVYLWKPGKACAPVIWRKSGQTLEYEMNLEGNLHLLAQISLAADGVRYRFEFSNRSDVAYDRVEAIWDPRLNESRFHDVRLERTYVHRDGKFELIASEMPQRLTMPLSDWLPVRYLDSYTWAVPVTDRRVVKDEAGITYRNASRAVDLPVIATLSPEGMWVAASYSKGVGNVWTNPDLTCLHANPETTLPARSVRHVDGATFVFRGSLDDLVEKIKQQP